VAPVHRCLAELNAALIRLDVDAIESCRNTLEELKPELQRSLDRVWLSYWTLTVKPRGQAYEAGEVLGRLQAPIDHLVRPHK
jgi:hypothetical protein